MTDIDRQNDEIEILYSIYGINIINIRSNNCNNNKIIEIKLNENILIRAILPEDYPSISKPIIELIGRNISNDIKNITYQSFNEIFNNNNDEVVLFDCIEWVKENIINNSSLISLTSSSSIATTTTLTSNSNSMLLESESISESQSVKSSVSEESEQLEFSSNNKINNNNNSNDYNIYHGETLIDRKSVFQAHVASISSVEDAKNVLAILKSDRKISRATHNMYAYRIILPSNVSGMEPIQIADNDDDGEDAARPKLAQLLSLMNVTNIIVVVSRWYGGIQLGPDRFRHIANVARIAIESSGLSTRTTSGSSGNNNHNNNSHNHNNKKSHSKKK